MFANGLQGWHLIILVLLVVLLFGAKRLPDAARSIGKSMKIFKAETKDLAGENKPAGVPEGKDKGFYVQLTSGKAPAWLQPVDLPAWSPLKMWRVAPVPGEVIPLRTPASRPRPS